jgi:hypothetical protein
MSAKFQTSSRLQLQGVWETIESNMEVFNVKKLPLMLVPFLDLHGV